MNVSTFTIAEAIIAKSGPDGVRNFRKAGNPTGRRLGGTVSHLIGRLDTIAKYGETPEQGWTAMFNMVTTIMPSLNGSATRVVNALSSALSSSLFARVRRREYVPDIIGLLSRIERLDLGPEFKSARTAAWDLRRQLTAPKAHPKPAPAQRPVATPVPTPTTIPTTDLTQKPVDKGNTKEDLAVIPQLMREVMAINHQVAVSQKLENGLTVERQVALWYGHPQLRLKLSAPVSDGNTAIWVVWRVTESGNCHILSNTGLGVSPKTVANLTASYLRCLLMACKPSMWKICWDATQTLAAPGQTLVISKSKENSTAIGIMRRDTEGDKMFSIRVQRKNLGAVVNCFEDGRYEVQQNNLPDFNLGQLNYLLGQGFIKAVDEAVIRLKATV